MEIAFKEQMNVLADKVENFLFGNTASLSPGQTQYFQSFFTESFIFPMSLLKFIRHEITIGFSFNMLLFIVLIFYMPFNFYYCWTCDSLMTLWIFFLSILNSMALIPKMLLLLKLYKIEETNDIYLANYLLWIFFRSKVYKFNSVMSRYIFCTYMVGGILIWCTKRTQCAQFFWLLLFLLACFSIRTIASFVQFTANFNNPQNNAEELFKLFNGISTEEIGSLKIMTYQNYLDSKGRIEIACPICYEDYENYIELRVMECPGNHVFHKKCIDKWLIKSNKCPMCNLSVFLERNKDKNNGLT